VLLDAFEKFLKQAERGAATSLRRQFTHPFDRFDIEVGTFSQEELTQILSQRTRLSPRH
jgi:hypothetical protein